MIEVRLNERQCRSAWRAPGPALCECGNEKDAFGEACDRCEMQDGTSRYWGRATVISELRQAEVASVDELAARLNAKVFGISKHLRSLQRDGLVRSWYDPIHPDESPSGGNMASGYRKIWTLVG